MPAPNESPAKRLYIPSSSSPSPRDQARAEKLEPFLWPCRPAVVGGACLRSSDDRSHDSITNARPDIRRESKLWCQKNRSTRRAYFDERRFAEAGIDEYIRRFQYCGPGALVRTLVSRLVMNERCVPDATHTALEDFRRSVPTRRDQDRCAHSLGARANESSEGLCCTPVEPETSRPTPEEQRDPWPIDLCDSFLPACRHPSLRAGRNQWAIDLEAIPQRSFKVLDPDGNVVDVTANRGEWRGIRLD